MTDLPLSVVATRPELDNVDLDLNDGTAYRIVSMGPAARVRRNSYNKSGNVHGGTLNNSVLDVLIRPVVIRVFGSSQAQFDTRLLKLVETFEQSWFHLTESKNGAATTYRCMTCESISPADSTGGATDEWDKYQLMATPIRHTFRIQVPTQPQPITGPI